MIYPCRLPYYRTFFTLPTLLHVRCHAFHTVGFVLPTRSRLDASFHTFTLPVARYRCLCSTTHLPIFTRCLCRFTTVEFRIPLRCCCAHRSTVTCLHALPLRLRCTTRFHTPLDLPHHLPFTPRGYVTLPHTTLIYFTVVRLISHYVRFVPDFDLISFFSHSFTICYVVTVLYRLRYRYRWITILHTAPVPFHTALLHTPSYVDLMGPTTGIT